MLCFLFYIRKLSFDIRMSSWCSVVCSSVLIRRRGTAFLASLTSQQILGLRVRQAKPLATALVVDLAGWHRDVTEELTSFQVDLRMDGLGREDLPLEATNETAH